MGACISQDELDKSVNKFGIKSGIGNDVPQLYCGCIYPGSQRLTGPSSGVDCVFYETKATTKNGAVHQDQKSMIKYHTLETKQVDFIISDNPGNPLSSWIYVPVSFFSAKVNGAKSHPLKINNPDTAVIPSSVESLIMSAPDQHSLTWSLDNKQLVFSDDVLEIGQQVAILGIIKEITMFSGETARILTPVTSVNMTDEFYRQNNWSAADKDRFNDITGSTPTFLISGKNQHFSASSTVSPRGSAFNVPFPSLDEVRSTYKSRYLPFFVEQGTTQNTTTFDSERDDVEPAPVGQLRGQHSTLGQMASFAPVHVHHHRPQLPSQGHQTNARHVLVSHIAEGPGSHIPPLSEPYSNESESGRTMNSDFKPLSKEHRDNQQDFEDTVRTRQ